MPTAQLERGPTASPPQARRTGVETIGNAEHAGRRARRSGIINLDAERETEVSGG
jgi:hypothetical protein